MGETTADRPWYVWETEIPEEGGCFIDAPSAAEAKRIYENNCGGRPEEAENDWLSAKPITAEEADRQFALRDELVEALENALHWLDQAAGWVRAAGDAPETAKQCSAAIIKANAALAKITNK